MKNNSIKRKLVNFMIKQIQIKNNIEINKSKKCLKSNKLKNNWFIKIMNLNNN